MVHICASIYTRDDLPQVITCLDSLRSIISSVFVLDTGSIDDTPNTILTWSQTHHIPVQIEATKFIDFNQMENACMQGAKLAFPEADYILRTEASTQWLISPDFDPVSLTASIYLVSHRYRQYTLHIPFLFEANQPWHCKGPHQSWHLKGSKAPPGHLICPNLHTITAIEM